MNSQHAATQSEWLRVMLAEVARKQVEDREGRAEEELRCRENQRSAAPAPAAPRPAPRTRKR